MRDWDANSYPLPVGIEGIYEWVSFIIFVLINIGSLMAAVIMGYWYIVRLRRSTTTLKPLIGSIALAKLNLFGWSVANMYAMGFSDSVPPLETLPFRVAWLIVLFLQVRTITRVRPSQSAEMVAELIRGRVSNRILILEDDRDIAELYKIALSDFGHDVVVAGTGSYALSVIEWQMPELIIVDIRLPDMTGYEFIAKARCMGYIGPAIAVSGAPLERMDGFSAFLQKPFKPSEIVAKVEYYLEKKHDHVERSSWTC